MRRSAISNLASLGQNQHCTTRVPGITTIPHTCDQWEVVLLRRSGRSMPPIQTCIHVNSNRKRPPASRCGQPLHLAKYVPWLSTYTLFDDKRMQKADLSLGSIGVQTTYGIMFTRVQGCTKLL